MFHYPTQKDKIMLLSTKKQTPATIYDIETYEMDMWRSLIDIPVYVILPAIALKGNLSQQEMSDMLGCNKKTIVHWLTGGRTPGFGYKALIDVRAYMLGVGVEECRQAVSIARLAEIFTLPEAISQLINEDGHTYGSIAEETGSSVRSVSAWHRQERETSLFPSLRLYRMIHDS